MRIDEQAALGHEARNLLHSALLLGGMGALLLLLGYVLLGPVGAWVVGFLGLAGLLISPRVSPRMVLRLYGARSVGYGELVAVQELLALFARHAGLRSIPRLYYLPSRVMNAFSVGDRDNAAIGVTDGLLRRLNLRELAGVLAHEVAHVRHNDVWVMGLADLIGRLTSSLSIGGQLLLLFNLPLLLLGQALVSWSAVLLLLLGPVLITMLQLALARTREFQADVGAVRLTGDPVGLASALEKLERYERGVLARVLLPGHYNPQPSVLRTHPATAERVARLLELERPPEPAWGAPFGTPRAVFELPAELLPVTRAPRWRLLDVWY